MKIKTAQLKDFLINNNFYPQNQFDNTVLAKLKDLEEFENTYHKLSFIKSLTEHKYLKEIMTLGQNYQEKYEDIVFVGIGGSSLGTKFLIESLGEMKKFHFAGETLDDFFVNDFLDEIIVKNPLFIFTSKSGNTLEIATWYKVLEREFGDYLKDNSIFITSNPNSELGTLAKENGCHILDIPAEVGGRFSIFTAVGLFAAKIAGVNTERLIQSAKDFSLISNVQEYALMSYLLYKVGYTNDYLISYNSGLEQFGHWWAQLTAESLGKNSEIGPNPLSLIGPSYQHSYLQLLLGGPKDKFVTIISVKPTKSENEKVLNAEIVNTLKSFDANKIPYALIQLEDISEVEVANLVTFFELVTVLQANLFGINPFDQPAVEESKKFLKM